MAYGDTPHDPMLRDAWADFCDGLKAAGDIVFRDAAPSTPLDRATGFQYLSRYISRALDATIEYNDPLFPQLQRHMTPTNKYGGDNPDALYLRARIDGAHTYRVVGDRGNVAFTAFTVVRKAEDVKPGTPVEVGNLFGHQLRAEWDGSFQLILSPEKHPGNWIRTTPDSHWLTIRQFFGDWEREEPMTVRIERVGADGAPAPMTPERIAAGLREAPAFIVRDTVLWAEWIEVYQDNVNRFNPRRNRDLGGAPGKRPLYMYWKVQPDQALLIEVVPPPAPWWDFELNNYWMNSLDYRYHFSSLNSSQAVLEENGLLRIVLAHQDPGVPNWLETGGHREGRIGIRWMLTDQSPVPETRLVKLADLRSILPSNARRVSPPERREQLRRRKIGVDRRFRV